MIRKYLNQNGENLWEVYVNIRNPNNSSQRIQKRLKGLKTEALAKKQELQLTRECERAIVAEENRAITWGELVDKFELHLREDGISQLTDVTKSDYIATLRKYTTSWNSLEATSVSSFEIRQLFNRIKDDITVTHQARIKMILNKVFRFGIDYKLIKNEVLPTTGIKILLKRENVPEVLTLNEIRKLLQAAKTMDYPWYPIWAMALLTGMRNGEIFALIWDDIDLNGRIITVSKSFNKRLRKTKSTKSGEWRKIPISPELHKLLIQLRLNSKGSSYVLPRIRDWSNGYQARALRAFCLSVGLPSIRFHALRACFATQLLKEGIPSAQIQKICGWKDLKTMQRYIRLSGIEVDGVTDGLKILPDDEVMGEVVQLFSGV